MPQYAALMKSLDTATTLVSNSAMAEEDKSQILTAIKEAKRPLDTDVWIWRIIIIALALIAVVPCVSGVLVTPPTTFKDVLPLAAAALGGLVGLLAPSPVKGG